MDIKTTDLTEDLKTSVKANIVPIAPSALLTRIQDFLPKLEKANTNLIPLESSSCGVEIIQSGDDDESSSCSSSSDSSDDDDDSMVLTTEVKSCVEINVDVFREKEGTVDLRDVSVQQVDELPEAFCEEESTKEITPRKPLIEEL